MPIWLGETSLDGICVHSGECTVGGALYGVYIVATGAAGVVGATAVNGLATWVAGADADATGATSPLLDVSGLTASGWHSQMWSWAHLYWCRPCKSHYWLCGWWWQGATGPWCHWEHIQFGQWRMGVSFSSFTGHGTLHSGWHIGWDGHVHHQHVGWCAWSVVAQWYIALTGITFPQANTSEHWLACYGMLAKLSMGLWPEHMAWVTNPLTVLMAASAWPLLLGFLDELMLWSDCPVCFKLSEECTGKLGVHCQYGVPLGCHVLQRVPSGLKWSWRHCIEMQGFCWW